MPPEKEKTMENGKIIGWKDYFDVEGTYGKRQGRARYIIEKEFNDTEASCHSIKEGIQWIQELLDEYRTNNLVIHKLHTKDTA